MPSFDTTLIVIIVSMASAIGLLGNIWLAGIFMMLFFPLNLWPGRSPFDAALVGLATALQADLERICQLNK